jgi:hypothetical protein
MLNFEPATIHPTLSCNRHIRLLVVYADTSAVSRKRSMSHTKAE